MSAFDTVLAALDTAGVKVMAGRDSARAQCPSHGSTGLTLAVTRRDDRALLHCHAGCDAADVLGALGLGLGDLYDGDRPPGYVPPPRRVLSPWESALAEVGIRNPPPVEHVVERMLRDQTPGHDGAAFDERRDRDIADARQARPGDRAPGEVTSW